MSGKGFGHVGDPERKDAKPEQIPYFDQAQVDYLTKTFPDRSATILTLNGAEATFRAVCIRQGESAVIEHLQSLVDQQKEQAR